MQVHVWPRPRLAPPLDHPAASPGAAGRLAGLLVRRGPERGELLFTGRFPTTTHALPFDFCQAAEVKGQSVGATTFRVRPNCRSLSSCLTMTLCGCRCLVITILLCMSCSGETKWPACDLSTFTVSLVRSAGSVRYG